jgi:MFS family permease
MPRTRLHVLLLNAGHFIDHLVMLVFATVAALALSREWGKGYAELEPYASPGFIAFGVFSMPAGWLADRWSREGMMVVYFVGVGLAAILTGFSRTPTEIAAGLFLVGVFAAIYHPVGLALIYDTTKRAGTAIAANGVWGNLGVGSAALITGYFIDHGDWRAAFFVPGAVSIVLGLAYAALMRAEIAHHTAKVRSPAPAPKRASPPHPDRNLIWRVTAIVFFTTAVSGLIFQSTTFALPKVFDERLTSIAPSATWIGWLAFLVFAVASIGQLIVGRLLDTLGPRIVFMSVAAIQVVFFALMPGLTGWPAVAVALAFMLGAFGQIPINDYMIGRMATPERRASIYGVRFVVTFAVLGAALPFISWVHKTWGFDTLFRILSVCAAIVLTAASLLPGRMPDAAKPAAAE